MNSPASAPHRTGPDTPHHVFSHLGGGNEPFYSTDSVYQLRNPWALFVGAFLVGTVLYCVLQVLKWLNRMACKAWKILAHPILADVHPFKFLSAWLVVITLFLCAFPLVTAHYGIYSTQPIATVDCPGGWTFYAGVCYRYFGEPTPSLNEAVEVCTRHGAILAVTMVQDRNQFIRDYMIPLELTLNATGQTLQGVPIWHRTISSEDQTCPELQSCPVVCEKNVVMIERVISFDDTITSLYELSILMFVIPFVEMFLCNEYVLWIGKGNEATSESSQQVLRAWKEGRSLGILLVSLLHSRGFVSRPAWYLCKRLLLAILTFGTALGVGSALYFHFYPWLLSEAFVQHVRLHCSERQINLLCAAVRLLTDVVLLPLAYMVFTRIETLFHQTTVANRLQNTEDDNAEVALGSNDASAPEPLPIEAGQVASVAEDAATASTTTVAVVSLCRICQDSDPVGLIRPCQCRGTMAWVHIACLDKWRTMSTAGSATRCDVCRCPYTFQPIPVTFAKIICTLVSPFTTILRQVAVCITGLVALVGIYIQGNVLLALISGDVSIYYFCAQVAEDATRIEVPPMFTLEVELLMLGIAFYTPMVSLWTIYFWKLIERFHIPMPDELDAIVFVGGFLRWMLCIHTIVNVTALEWRQVVALLPDSFGPLPSLPGPLDFKSFLVANFACFLLLTLMCFAFVEIGMWCKHRLPHLRI